MQRSVNTPRSLHEPVTRPLIDELAPPRIIVVDDDAEMRAILVQCLRDEGYEVMEARDGAETLAQLRAAPAQGGGRAVVDLVVADVRMPKVTGIELLQRIRAADWSTPVVLITAFAEPGLRAEARRLGAAGVLSKPFSLQDLFDVVDRLTSSAWSIGARILERSEGRAVP